MEKDELEPNQSQKRIINNILSILSSSPKNDWRKHVKSLSDIILKYFPKFDKLRTIIYTQRKNIPTDLLIAETFMKENPDMIIDALERSKSNIKDFLTIFFIAESIFYPNKQEG